MVLAGLGGEGAVRYLGDERLTGRQHDGHLGLSGEELVDGALAPGAAGEPVVVEDHPAARVEARVDELAGVLDRLVDVHVDVAEGEPALRDARERLWNEALEDEHLVEP